jgi:hypothetical protein
MARRPDRAVGRFIKQLCDELDQVCEYAPVKPSAGVNENKAHCNIVGEKPEAVKREFARNTMIVCLPDWSRISAELRDPES